MKHIYLLLALIASPQISLANAELANAIGATYVSVESFNDVDVTHMAIDIIGGKALESELKKSKECGSSKFDDLMYYMPTDTVEDAVYVYAEPVSSLLANLKANNLIVDSDAQVLASEIEKSSLELSAYLNGKLINICTEYSVPAYSDGQTTSYIMVDGKVEFAVFVGRPD